MKCTGSQFCECRKCEAAKFGIKPTSSCMVDSVVGHAQCPFCPLTHREYRRQREVLNKPPAPCKHDRHVFERTDKVRVCADCGSHVPNSIVVTPGNNK